MVELTLVYGRYNHGILAFIGVYRGIDYSSYSYILWLFYSFTIVHRGLKTNKHHWGAPSCGDLAVFVC